MGIEFWIGIILVGGIVIMALLSLLVFGSSFFLAFMNRPRLLTFTPAPSHLQHKSKKARDRIVEAEILGMRRVGSYLSDRQEKPDEPWVTLLLSEDHKVLTLIHCQSAMGYTLYTCMEDGAWIATEQQMNSPEKTPYFEPASLNGGTMKQALAFHLDRVAEDRRHVVPFEPEGLVDRVMQQELKEAGFRVDQGLARWTNPEQTAWRATLSGALRHAKLCATDTFSRKNMERRERYLKAH